MVLLLLLLLLLLACAASLAVRILRVSLVLIEVGHW
jgi:hypothetical protein